MLSSIYEEEPFISVAARYFSPEKLVPAALFFSRQLLKKIYTRPYNSCGIYKAAKVFIRGNVPFRQLLYILMRNMGLILLHRGINAQAVV
jgi:hypothetical protein